MQAHFVGFVMSRFTSSLMVAQLHPKDHKLHDTGPFSCVMADCTPIGAPFPDSPDW